MTILVTKIINNASDTTAQIELETATNNKLVFMSSICGSIDFDAEQIAFSYPNKYALGAVIIAWSSGVTSPCPIS